jgi:signal peptidase I
MTKTDLCPVQPAHVSAAAQPTETFFEMIASLCTYAVVILFLYTFLGQNFVIPSGSMEKTLLVGDHLFVDRITFAPAAQWMPLVHYREPQRGDIVVFIKPSPDLDASGYSQYSILVKRLIGLPGDHIHLSNGKVFVNGVEQAQPHAEQTTEENHSDFLDEFPSVPPSPPVATEAWSIEFSQHLQNNDLVVPANQYFMMGDHRHNSLDSRYWGFVPRDHILGRPVLNYWSCNATEAQYEQTGLANGLARIGYSLLHFFTETRWDRTLHLLS